MIDENKNLTKDVDLDKFSEDDLRIINKLIEIRNTRVLFAKKYHRNTKGEHLEFGLFPHIRDLYNTLDRRICVMGGAQIFKTDWLIVDTLANAYNGLSVFFVLPKMDMRDSFVQEKVQRPISLSPEYKEIVSKSSCFRVQQMQFGKAFIKFVGSNVSSDFVSFSGDVYVCDELDKCEDMDNIELGYSRLDASIYKFERMVSNPTTKAGPIYKKFLESDQRKWMCPCDKCKEFSELDFFNSVVKEIKDSDGNIVDHILMDDSWRPGCGRDIRIICPKCGSGSLNRFSQDSVWVPTSESFQKIAGYHMPSIVSTRNSVHQIWVEFMSALDNPSKMTRFYSMRLGLPYSPQGQKISEATLDNCIEKGYVFKVFPDYACVPENSHKGPCSMGVDVSPSHLDVRISVDDRGKRRCVYLGKLDGKSWHTLHDLIERYNVSMCVIDYAPEITLTQEFVNSASCEAWRIRYLGAGTERTMKMNNQEQLIVVDRTEALDRSFSQIRSGKNILPENISSIFSGSYVKEMCNLSREVDEDRKGNLRYEWVGTFKDHHRHADAYDMIAFSLMSEYNLTSDSVFIG